MQEFQSFSERLHNGIRKRNFTAVGVKKEVKDIGHITIEIKKKVEVIFIPFKIKKEIEELGKIEIVQKKVDLNSIPKLI